MSAQRPVTSASTRFHPRVSINSICSMGATLAEDIDFWRRAGVHAVGVQASKLGPAEWDDGLLLVRDAGLVVANVVAAPAFHLDDRSRWDSQRELLIRTLDVAATVGASCAYMTSGPPGRLTTDEAVVALGEALTPVLAHAQERGVALAMEHNSPLGREYGCVHSLADMIETADEIGIGICVELSNCWVERHVDRLFRRGVDHIRLVQVSDFVVGTAEARSRAVPGDGDIPLEWLIGELLEAGYSGWFDIELLGPRIVAEGYETATIRAATYVSDLLDRLGV